MSDMSDTKAPFDPVGMKFPNPSDFRQSDEYAEEYEEVRRVRELLKGKMDSWWKELNKQKIHRFMIFILTFIMPVFWTALMIVKPASDTTLGMKIATVAVVIAFTWIFYFIGIGIGHIPYLMLRCWRWVWREED